MSCCLGNIQKSLCQPIEELISRYNQLLKALILNTIARSLYYDVSIYRECGGSGQQIRSATARHTKPHPSKQTGNLMESFKTKPNLCYFDRNLAAADRND